MGKKASYSRGQRAPSIDVSDAASVHLEMNADEGTHEDTEQLEAAATTLAAAPAAPVAFSFAAGIPVPLAAGAAPNGSPPAFSFSLPTPANGGGGFGAAPAPAAAGGGGLFGGSFDDFTKQREEKKLAQEEEKRAQEEKKRAQEERAVHAREEARLLIVEPRKDTPGQLHAFLLANPLAVPAFKLVATDATNAAWLGEAVKATPELAELTDADGHHAFAFAHLRCKQACERYSNLRR